MSPFLSGAELDALDRHRAAERRARRVTAVSAGLWFSVPIGGVVLILAALITSLVALALSAAADELRVGMPVARRVR